MPYGRGELSKAAVRMGGSVVIVKLFGNLRQLAGEKVLHVEGATVLAVLLELSEQNPGLGSAILEQGKPRPYVKVMVNGKDMALSGGLLTPLQAGDAIAIFPPIAGG